MGFLPLLMVALRASCLRSWCGFLFGNNCYSKVPSFLYQEHGNNCSECHNGRQDESQLITACPVEDHSCHVRPEACAQEVHRIDEARKYAQVGKTVQSSDEDRREGRVVECR